MTLSSLERSSVTKLRLEILCKSEPEVSLERVPRWKMTSFIGAGVTIVSGITIGKGARIGAGSVVIGPVKAGETVFGNPAQKVSN